jgi:acyl phosphate:glycerol-3-phosphate acyltransferase
MLTTYLTVALFAYLLGSIPFGYILVKLFLKQDIRTTGSGNIGATNVARSGKKGLAIATLLLDAGKGYLAVLGVFFVPRPRFFYGNIENIHSVEAVAALCAILGHCFPVWLRFKGGKGVATALGAFVAISPEGVGVSFLVFLLCFALSRYVSASSIAAAVAFPFSADFLTQAISSMGLVMIATSSAVIILKHHSNIRRLLNGTEPKFGVKRPAIDPIQVEKNA